MPASGEFPQHPKAVAVGKERAADAAAHTPAT